MADWPYNTREWVKLRLMKLAHDQWCEVCRASGRFELANTVDHRIAISAGGQPFPGLSGLASLCPGHHSQKTARGPEAGAVRTRKPMTALKPRKGCNADGSPLDPHHPWNAQAGAQSSGKSLRAKRPIDRRPTNK